MLQALIWDVDGTVAETERDGHRVAFNLAFEAFGLPVRWDVEHYGHLLHITGGRERLLHDFASRPDVPPPGPEREALARALHQHKNQRYAELVEQGRIQARPGVLRLMQQVRAAGLRQAIATTTSRSNVEALFGCLLGADWQRHFDAVVCGEDVQRKKPDPEAYLLAMGQIGVTPDQALAVEDAEPGMKAALAAGLPVLLTPSVYFAREADSRALLVCGAGLDDAPLEPGRRPLQLADLQRLHAGRAG